MRSTETYQVCCRRPRKTRQNTCATNIPISPGVLLVIVTAIISSVLLSCGSQVDSTVDIGDRPSVAQHVGKDDIANETHSVQELISIGKQIFTASFNTLDGSGNAKTRLFKDTNERDRLQSTFNRISGPDANACSGCHNVPIVGGGGDNVANVFVLARRFPNVNFDAGSGDLLENLTLKTVGNERGTISMFGSGIIELLAREMTRDLHRIRNDALERAQITQKPVTASIETKGVHFGKLTAWPDGLLDVSKVEGIDEDLIIKPFGQKGVYTSLREFTLDALELHHGIQAEERVGSNHDADLDGIVNEMTIGDLTALTLFQASLQLPTIGKPTSDLAKSYVDKGKMLFDDIGCAVCHKPFLELNSPIYVEPNPYNPPGTISDYSTPSSYHLDLVSRSSSNTIKATNKGTYLVYAYTDLKRHDMGPILANETIEQRFVESPVWITRKLWGTMSEPPFLHHGRATLVSEAIIAHGGEANSSRMKYEGLSADDKAALIEFLKTFQTPSGP